MHRKSHHSNLEKGILDLMQKRESNPLAQKISLNIVGTNTDSTPNENKNVLPSNIVNWMFNFKLHIFF